MGLNLSRSSMYLEFFTIPTISKAVSGSCGVASRRIRSPTGLAPFPNRRANSWLTIATLGELGVSCSYTGLPVLTDVHEPGHCAIAAEAVDVLQIPAFLCRQTDLLVAAGKTGRAINIKKGQFVAPWDMTHPVEKVRSTGNERVFLTERGASFGYNTLVVDYRSLPVMRRMAPVVFDGTHSVQQPSAADGVSGGQAEVIPLVS